MRLTEADRTAILADGASVRFDLDDCVVQRADHCVDLLTVSEAQVMRALRVVAMLDEISDRKIADMIDFLRAEPSPNDHRQLARALEEVSR